MSTRPIAIDLFAGAGGWSCGLEAAGFRVLWALDQDPLAAATYRANHPGVPLLEKDIGRRPDLALLERQRGTTVDLLVASPPCQPFSNLRPSAAADDERAQLWESAVDVILTWRPRAFIIENVPGFLGKRGSQVQDLGGAQWDLAHVFPPRTYHIAEEIAGILWDYAVVGVVWDAADYGVPQRRRRAFLLGRRIWDEGEELGLFGPGLIGPSHTLPTELGKLLFAWPTPTLRPRTVREAWAGLPAASAGADLLHQAPAHTAATRRRLAALRPGEDGRPRRGVMRRMVWDAPAPTITTGCDAPTKGWFVHPTENRGITLREAARLQTFPDNYVFLGSRRDIARQIGNAMPPAWAQVLGAAAQQTLALPARERLAWMRAVLTEDVQLQVPKLQHRLPTP